MANTATQQFFRSTDRTAQRYVGGLCPLTRNVAASLEAAGLPAG